MFYFRIKEYGRVGLREKLKYTLTYKPSAINIKKNTIHFPNHHTVDLKVITFLKATKLGVLFVLLHSKMENKNVPF